MCPVQAVIVAASSTFAPPKAQGELEKKYQEMMPMLPWAANGLESLDS